MKKLLLFILVGIIIAGIYLSSGGNISSSEMMLSESKARDAISKVIGAIDTVGDGAFYDVDIDVKGFKGVVEQPASSFESAVEEYQVTDGLSLKYGGKSITLEPASAAEEKKGIINNSLPKDVRESKKGSGIKNVKVVGTKGLNPILRNSDPKEYKEWTDDFLFTPQGLNLGEVPGIKLDALKGKGKEALRKDLLNFIFGDTDGTDYTWDLFKVDRLVAVKEINVEALTGVEKNKDVQKLIDPNRVAIYQVEHVNTNNFRNENFSPEKFSSEPIKNFTDSEPSKFMYDLASHLNQVVGGKILIIPHKDTFKIDIAGNPLFKLN